MSKRNPDQSLKKQLWSVVGPGGSEIGNLRVTREVGAVWADWSCAATDVPHLEHPSETLWPNLRVAHLVD